MKSVTGWWFCKERKLPHNDGRKIKVGSTHEVKGDIIPCENGLHLSVKILDALQYAPGNIIYRVNGYGTIVPHNNDKFACSHRTYLAGGIDVEKTLRKFACLCALDVIHLWSAPDIVIKYLKTQNEKIRVAAWAATRVAARDAAWVAARDAAWDAAWAAAWDAARDAARVAARDAARDAARAKNNRRLHKMVMYQIKKEV